MGIPVQEGLFKLGGDLMVMDKITVDEAIDIAKSKRLKPAMVKGTSDGVQFTKGRNPNLETISWDDFKKIMKEKKLAVYESGGWMKIMKR